MILNIISYVTLERRFQTRNSNTVLKAERHETACLLKEVKSVRKMCRVVKVSPELWRIITLFFAIVIIWLASE
jgi:hypothetical protein